MMQLLYLCKNRLNQLTSNPGEIPKEISNLIELEALNLEINRLSGPLPMEIFNIPGMRKISLSYNNLSGSLPPNMCSILPNIEKLYLNSLTNLVGTIPHSISNCSKLTHLELSYNQFTSLIPNSLGYLTHLQLLNLGGNNLTSDIIKLPGFLIQLQKFNSSLSILQPSKWHASSLHGEPFHLSKKILRLQLQNQRVKSKGSWELKQLIRPYLSVNQFSKEIPSEIGGLQTLAYLSLRHNKLEGAIPDSMSNMVGLGFLDLSHNNISGIISKSLEKLQNLKYRRGKRAPQQPDSLASITRERISYYELLQATEALSESNLIGSGSFGLVYKGVLRSGTAIGVKVFNLQLDAAFNSFDTECEILRSFRLRNLVKVITSCSNLDFKDLVLEYMPNGILEKYWYSHKYFLHIMQRLSRMIDMACALEYLHHGCLSPVIHCDLKLSNVFLDEDMVAHLRDFGISKLLCENESDLYTKTFATLGYIAPSTSRSFANFSSSFYLLEIILHLYINCLTVEYGLDGLVSTKGDVYSYGIMLLETFTRRRPNEFEGDLSLKQWVSNSIPEALMDVVNVNLVTSMGNRYQKEVDLVASIMKVALDCCTESPAGRTNMKDVVGMLQMMKIQLLAF
ncbi:hypothetical protein CQW23_21163 [Capsicum baccatum]|uniref:Protein kinase domain-containing protein n=1 Tax=Capsicum baccatum TaxID=33114 RepID=A0A2G2VX83_CAPBA|nr:hypothetical protein CQW23_21163 [Capsicum baccatum]